MKKILLIIAVLMLSTSCATGQINMRSSYVMDNGYEFMCDVGVTIAEGTTPEGEFNCKWKVPTETAVLTCEVGMDKLKKGYKPNLELDCSVAIAEATDEEKS